MRKVVYLLEQYLGFMLLLHIEGVSYKTVKITM